MNKARQTLLKALAVSHMAMLLVYGLVYFATGWAGLEREWGGLFGFLGAVSALPLPYGVYVCLVEGWAWPTWAAVLAAVPGLPVVAMGLLRTALGDDSL